MAFDVFITDEAFANLDAIADFITKQSTAELGRKWFDAIVTTIQTLREMPARCPRVPEVEEVRADVRLLLHGRKSRAYKIYFKVVETARGSGSVSSIGRGSL